MLGKKYLRSCEMSEVIMHTAEKVSTREATERSVKVLDSTYAKE